MGVNGNIRVITSRLQQMKHDRFGERALSVRVDFAVGSDYGPVRFTVFELEPGVS